MNLTGNTIFVTGGGSGIGRGLAEALHRLGNQVIISGRRKGHLAETTKANPGMKSVELDVEDPASIAAVTQKLIEDYPSLNVLINNAGVMHVDNAAGAVDEAMLADCSFDAAAVAVCRIGRSFFIPGLAFVVSAKWPLRRPEMITWLPSRWSASASPRPIPEPPPVTKIVLPVSFICSPLFLLVVIVSRS